MKTTSTYRPRLHVNHALSVSLKGKDFLTAGLSLARPGVFMVTFSEGQPWDALLDEGYRIGALLLELDDDERVVKVYQRAGV